MDDYSPLEPMPSSEERNAALIAHALTFVEGGIVGPLVFYLFRKPILESLFSTQDSEFVAFHSLQSFYFGLLFGPAVILVVLCGFCFPPLWLFAVLMAPIYLIYEIIGCVHAHQGKWFRLPIVGHWAWKSHPPPISTTPRSPGL